MPPLANTDENASPEHEEEREHDDGSGKPLVSVSATDIFGFGRGLEALMEALRAGIGPTFEPYIRRRIARADQEAARGWLKLTKRAGLHPSAMEVETVAGRSDVRLFADAQVHQRNRETIAEAAIEEARALITGGFIPKDDVVMEPEWLSRYWRLAQDISGADLQSLWARVLAREATGAGNVSPRTLETLAMLTRKEADQLVQVAPFCCTTTHGSRIECVFIRTLYCPDERRGELLEIAEINGAIQGLVQFDAAHFGALGICVESGWTSTFSLTAAPSDAVFSICGKQFRVAGVSQLIAPPQGVSCGGGSEFATTGREILGLIKAEPNAEFVRLFSEALQTGGLQLIAV